MGLNKKQIETIDTLKPLAESESDTHMIKGYVDDEGQGYVVVTMKGDKSETPLLIMQHGANATLQAILRVFNLLNKALGEAQ